MSSKVRTPEQKAQDAARTREWRKNNPEKAKESYRRSREKNKEKRRLASQAYREANKDATQESYRAWYEENRLRVADSRMRRRFKMSLADYDELLTQQNGVCAICQSPEPGGNGSRFCVDHNRSCCPEDNSCGQCVRGLLCVRCNTAIGSLKDNVDSLRKAIAYIERYEVESSR